MMKNNKLLTLFGFLLLSFLIAFVGSFATQESLTPWYSQLEKAPWNPPNWVFPPIWTVLYAMIALAGWLIYLSEKSIARSWALFFYFVQLVLNGLWSFFFFYFHNPWISLVDIILLNLFIFATLIAGFHTSKKSAGYLLLPYFFWTLYALTLNAAIVYLN